MLSLVSETICFALFFFFNDTATTEIYTLSLHDALPILFDTAETLDRCLAAARGMIAGARFDRARMAEAASDELIAADRKSTRLNSSHANISYAVFCLKKKKQNQQHTD